MRLIRPMKAITIPGLLTIVGYFHEYVHVHAFVVTQQSRIANIRFQRQETLWSGPMQQQQRQQQQQQQQYTTFSISFQSKLQSKSCLSMGFNLPPSRDSNNNNNNNNGSELVGGIVSLLALFAFFVSPLGGIFFSIVNSFVAFLFLTPLVLFVAFQVWQTLFTFDGPCPNCNASVKVLKDQQPTICLTCGSFVQSNAKGNGIDFAPQNDVVLDDADGISDSSIESLLSGLLGGFGEQQQQQQQQSTSVERQQQFKREQTVIDVEAKKDE